MFLEAEAILELQKSFKILAFARHLDEYLSDLSLGRFISGVLVSFRSNTQHDAILHPRVQCYDLLPLSGTSPYSTVWNTAICVDSRRLLHCLPEAIETILLKQDEIINCFGQLVLDLFGCVCIHAK